MFTQRDRKDEDWGQWVVVEKNIDLPHPSGTVPKFDDKSSNILENQSNILEKEYEEIIKSRIWYAVCGARNVRHLAEWIMYQTDLALFKEVTPTNSRNRHSSFPMLVTDTPTGSQKRLRHTSTDTPSRQLMVEVRLPQRPAKKASPADLVTKESTEALFAQLQKIANFMELNEEPQRLF